MGGLIQEPVAKILFLFRQLNGLSNEVLDCLSQYHQTRSDSIDTFAKQPLA
jgi:hypothetical protein